MMPTWTKLDNIERDAWVAEARRQHPLVRDTTEINELARKMYTETFG